MDEALEEDMTMNLVGGGDGCGGGAARVDTRVCIGSAIELGILSKLEVRGPDWGACERVSVGLGCRQESEKSVWRRKGQSRSSLPMDCQDLY